MRFKRIGQANLNALIIPAAIVLLFLLIPFLFGFNPEKQLIIAAAIAAFLVALINTNASLIMLIFSMLLSPEFSVGELGPRAIAIRLDDLLLLVISFTWLVKMAINKKLGLLRVTPLNAPLLSFIAICIISTLLNLAEGEREITLIRSIFYIIKYFEYFLLFFMVTDNIQSSKDIKRFTLFLFIVCILVSISTYPQIVLAEKTTAPFEGGHGGEPNTLAGYQILLLAISTGILLYAKSNLWQFSSIALILFTMPSFFYTQSRGGYLGFIFMYLALIILTRRKKAILIMILIAAVFFIPLVTPELIKTRINRTFTDPGRDYTVFGKRIHLEDSAANRIESSKEVFKKWAERPILGYGVTGLKLIDNQYTLVLGETGLIGVVIFVWLLAMIFKTSMTGLKQADDAWSQGLIVGFLAGFVGLLGHGFSASTFIIVRIMEPFWFIAAMINVLPEAKSEEK
ncbi:MAG: O-antigen ligase family protein [Candidatus Omnitrophota bacterium]